MIKKLEKNTVFIGIKKKISESQFAINIRGTGIIIEDGKLITCAHIYNEIQEVDRSSLFCGIPLVESDFNTEYRSFDIKMISSDQQNDLSLFEINDFDGHKADFGFKKNDFMTLSDLKKIKRTDKARFIGFPLANEFLQMGLGITLSASECIIGAIKYRNNGSLDFILIDKLVNPGNSGSPLYKGGKIIGLTSGTFNQTHKIGDALINVPVSIGIVRTANYIRDIIT